MRGRMGRLLTIAILVAGLATTSPFVAHADGSTECAAGTDTASLNNFIANEVGDLVGFDTTRVPPARARYQNHQFRFRAR